MLKPIKHISTFQIRSIHLAGYLKQRDSAYILKLMQLKCIFAVFHVSV